MPYQLNAMPCYHEANRRLLEKMVADGWEVDRFGHAKKTGENGKVYRYKFQARTVRFEVQVKHPASRYSPASTSWVRLRTLRYKKV